MMIFSIEWHNIRSFKLKERGFSLVELVVVIGIIAILAAISMTSMDLVRKQRVSSATKHLLGDLQSVRLDGMMSGPSGTNDARQYIRGAGIRLVSTSQYATFQFNDCNQDYQYQANGCSGSPEESPNTQVINLPTGVQIMRINGGNGGTLTAPSNSNADILMFDHLGLSRNYDWSKASTFYIVVQWPSLASSCVVISANKIREGSLNGTTCTEK